MPKLFLIIINGYLLNNSWRHHYIKHMRLTSRLQHSIKLNINKMARVIKFYTTLYNFDGGVIIGKVMEVFACGCLLWMLWKFWSNRIKNIWIVSWCSMVVQTEPQWITFANSVYWIFSSSNHKLSSVSTWLFTIEPKARNYENQLQFAF